MEQTQLNQTYSADTMTVNSIKNILKSKGLWKGYNLWKLYDGTYAIKMAQILIRLQQRNRN